MCASSVKHLLLASVVLVSTPIYSAEELYSGKALPPDDVLMHTANLGNILGKVSGERCHEVYFWPRPGRVSAEMKTFCRLDNDFWIYSPNSEGGAGMVFIYTQGD